MADLHILREHTLGFVAARKIAFQWAEQAEGDFGMACTYEEGEVLDEVHFTRSGVQGSLKVSQSVFELQAKLGFLLSAFKGAIESEIVKNLDTLLAGPATPAALVAGVSSGPARVTLATPLPGASVAHRVSTAASSAKTELPPAAPLKKKRAAAKKSPRAQ